MDPRSVGIVGVGLIGGSIALAALRSGYRVCLLDRSKASQWADSRFQNAQIANDLEVLAAESRFIILATPISAIALVKR